MLSQQPARLPEVSLTGQSGQLLGQLHSVLRSARRHHGLFSSRRNSFSEDIRNKQFEFSGNFKLSLGYIRGEALPYLTEMLSRVSANDAMRCHCSATCCDFIIPRTLTMSCGPRMYCRFAVSESTACFNRELKHTQSHWDFSFFHQKWTYKFTFSFRISAVSFSVFYIFRFLLFTQCRQLRGTGRHQDFQNIINFICFIDSIFNVYCVHVYQALVPFKTWIDFNRGADTGHLARRREQILFYVIKISPSPEVCELTPLYKRLAWVFSYFMFVRDIYKDNNRLGIR